MADVLRWESISYAQVELWGVADVRDAGEKQGGKTEVLSS